MERSTQQIQRLKEERAENEAKIEQLTHQNERLKAREQYLARKERDGRTHRIKKTVKIQIPTFMYSVPFVL